MSITKKNLPLILFFIMAMFALVKIVAGEEYYQGQHVPTVHEVTTQRDRDFIRRYVPGVDLHSVLLFRSPIDGRGDTSAQVSVLVERPSYVIFLDIDDWPVKITKSVWKDPLQREQIIHELVHISQTHRGKEYRIRAIKWMDEYGYYSQPMEIEAYGIAERARDDKEW